mmetsp:Transcript_106384/g.211338  ORF Transcript_106384/g.211338 Transcript_106384/m.211338 type:complete len:892 (+) Transcript_106384:65-2740(+)
MAAGVPAALARHTRRFPQSVVWVAGGRRSVDVVSSLALVPRTAETAWPMGQVRLASSSRCRFAASQAPWQSSSNSIAPSRLREVETACAALAESVQAGDSPWFERVVAQLRGVLKESQDHSAAGSFALPNDVAENAWPTGRTMQDAKPLEGLPAQRTPSSSRTVAPRHEEQPEEAAEPAWMQALRLLEEAAAAVPPQQRRVQQQPPRSAVAAAPTVASDAGSGSRQRPNEQEAAHVDVGPYLASFDQKPAWSPEEEAARARAALQRGGTAQAEEVAEPAWARALRLLDAVPVAPSNKGTTTPPVSPPLPPPPPSVGSASEAKDHEHAGKDEIMSRYSRLLGGSGAGTQSEDARKALRMKRYEELLHEADAASRAAPGASLPLRYDPRGASQPRKPGPPPPMTGTSVPSASGRSAMLQKEPWSEPAAPSESAAPSTRSKQQPATDPLSAAVGRGNLVTSAPVMQPEDQPPEDGGELRKEDFVWSEHEFNEGEKQNKRVLRGFRREFKQMLADTPEGLRNPKLLTAALDLALACVKCYELDKADAIYRRCIGECRRRGMPWDVKCIQDLATLRCKQHRQADAAELLEELAGIAPPHPATFINLGTVYNQLKQYDKAESWFLQAVNLKGGKPGREDLWNLGICKKNQGHYPEALPMLEQALQEFQEHEPDQPVTIAKLHSTVAGCMHDMGQSNPAVEHYQRAYDLLIGTVGTSSPLFCSAAEGLAKALRAESRFDDAFEALLDAFRVHATCDAVHPTPLFETLQLALKLHDSHSSIELDRMATMIDAAVLNLDGRGMAEDGNAGLVMARAAKVLSRASSALDNSSYRERAIELLERGLGLIRSSHKAEEADLSHEIMDAEVLMRILRPNNSGAKAETSALPPPGVMTAASAAFA